MFVPICVAPSQQLHTLTIVVEATAIGPLLKANNCAQLLTVSRFQVGCESFIIILLGSSIPEIICLVLCSKTQYVSPLYVFNITSVRHIGGCFEFYTHGKNLLILNDASVMNLL